ncbi:uncharacterized protein LOC125073467 [Vanessa atalanta]|uniref:uncharacterized protein LOC125073467 n=1 Tax=Vanessa atalanta TaxID=42275 RepID=UPI001FCD98C9|nr:uncharacterized protein LOC125073467 [Vanessa atalanta]
MECKVYEVPNEQTPSTSEYDFQQRKLTTESIKQDTAEGLHPEQINDVTSMDVTGDDQQPRVNELDKFKRRMIRAIARLMVEEKKPEAEIWNVLRKETSCDCKLLWTRMRALTIKKLKRLFDANDRNENVTKIARLSVTDWLLFDLTLVHEDVDVIGQENEKIKKEPQILEDLFKLVMKYKIEYLCGDPLTIAWNDLTAEYNSRGRKCSQMLLQRRWYQLKQHVRSKFYKFWFEYRGALKNLEQAEKYKPTDLDVEIVKAFMSVVTDPFPTWQQLIENKRVSLLKDFERLPMTKKKIAQVDDDEPDVLLIEPHVETIDLGLDSDEDTRDSNGSVIDVQLNNEPTADSNDENESLTAVKTESIYDICDEDEVSKLESMHIPLESKANLVINQCDQEIKATNLEKTNVSTNQIQVSHHCVEDEVDLIVNDDDIVNTQQAQDNDFEIVMPKITSITSTANILEINLENDNTTNGINNTLDNITDKIPETKSDTVTVTEEKSKNKEEITIANKKIKEPSLYNEDVPHDMHLIDGIELEDDGIEYIDEDEHTIEPKEEIKLEADNHISTKDDDDDTPKIDLKLLLNPVVFTKKLEDMDVFRFIDFMTIKDRRVLENAVIESKPVDKKSVKIDTISKECCDVPETNVNSDEASECSTENEYETIKSTSWLFRKPRTVTYNPIQLCKNPDFNTRLKRLTAGFFTSQRNRQLLNSCKPLTIDVHKAFEVKLVNNSLFLEKSFVLESQVSETTSTVEKSVLPSELPGQSLNYNVQNATSIPSTSKLNQVPNDEVICEACPVKGNKVINLPDLDQIRRKNEGLLIAEVTPLQAVNLNSKPPVSIVQKNKMIQENVLNINKVDNSDIAKDLNNIHGSTTAVSTAELKNKNFSSSEAPVEETEILCNDYRSDFNHVKQGYNQAIKFGNKPRRAAVKYKVGNVAVTWNSRGSSTFHANKQDDRLLAPDTVQRIISVCNGIHQHFTKKQNIANRKKYYRSGPGSNLIKKTVCDEFNLSSQKPQPETNEIQLKEIHSHKTEIKEDQEKQQPATIQKETIHQSEIETVTIENCVTTKNNYDGHTVQNYGIKNKGIGKKRKNSYCCWAREKILFWNNQIQRVRRHLCPRQKCTCCCNIIYITQLRQRRQKRYTNVSSICNLVSDDDSDHNTENLNVPQKTLKETKEASEKITKRIDKQLNKTSKKVSVGTNTDFDKEFEASYAANVNISNYAHETQPAITDVFCFDNKGSSSNSTQTFTYTKKESVSSLKFAVTSDIIGKEKSHLNNDVESDALNNVSSPLEKVIIKKDKPTKYGPKCKTIVRAATNYIQAASSLSNTNKDSLLCENPNNVHAASNYTLRAPKPDEEGLPTEHPNKVIVLQKNVKPNLSQKPICLGKNKILLCSLQPLSKTSMIDVTHLVENIKPQMLNCGINTHIPTLIPNGVHLVLLPNQELVLSIDPGVELNPTQINYLPIILNLVQQQLYALGAINKLPKANILTSDDVIQLSDEETENINADKAHNDNSNLENIKEVRHTPDSKLSDVENDISLNKADKYINDDSFSNIASSDTLPVVLINEFENENENKPKVDGASETESGKDLSEVDKQQNMFTDDSTITVDAVLDDNKKEDLNETTKTSKKTIISDLMEMSGISLEDTVVTNTENPINLIPPPQPISIIQEPIKEPNNLYGNKEEEANTNNIFNNPFVQAALTKCPELYIVCSYEDLKYAYKNNGQFYKMDIENGIIVPISVSIKKQMVNKNLKLDKTLKSVIDLTEEENTDNNTFSAESKSDESNIDTFIEKGFSSSGVKPIKLFKSVHPSILRHNFKTLSMRQNSADFNSKILTKKVIKVIKHKRKQVLKTREPKTKNLKKLVHEVEGNNIDSESDDEPLALKAKRIRRKSVEISENIDEVNSHNENSQLEVQPLYEQGANCDEATSHSRPMSVENQGETFGSSHLPIIFQSNDDESSEEDCILGV